MTAHDQPFAEKGLSLRCERWRPVVDWPAYQISDHGRVRGKQGLLKTFPIDGYPSFNVISPGGKRRSLRVHREVVRAFRGVRGDRLVRHRDGNPANCHLSNLRYGTHRQNEADKVRHGTKMEGERHHRAKLTADDVRAIRSSKESLSKTAAKYGISFGNVSAIRNRRIWRSVK